MRKFVLSFLLLFLLSFLAVNSLEERFAYSEILLTIKDIETDETIIASPVTINLFNIERGTEISSVKYLDYDGQIDYKLSPGTWKIEFKVDARKTPAVDYFAESSISVEEGDINRTIYVYPIGSVEGEVVDNDGNLVAKADIDFKCKSELSLISPNKTDSFGSFKAEFLPIGNCKVFAAYKGLAGVEEVYVQRGNLTNVRIQLDKPLQPNLNFLYIFGGILLLIFIVFFVYKGMSKGVKKKVEKEVQKEKIKLKKEAQIKKAKEEVKEEKKEEGGLNPRARDIMKTLNEKEKTVVDFLLESHNKSTQATIRNATGIPKTSLSRLFHSLEGKKVIEIERVGKLKKIELTGWFLGKD